jgi:GDP-L-fucose synthase
VPGLIRRFHESRLAGLAEVVCWGTGTPVRDFVYAGDVARTLPFFIDEYDSSEPVNLSSGATTPIRELAETIREYIGFPGPLVWDSSKPDGQMVKIFDVTRMKALGLCCGTTLQEGLRRTIRWFTAHYESRGDGIRL